jgi:bifunctional DNase/RNase
MKKWIIFLWILFSWVPPLHLGRGTTPEGNGDLEVKVKGVNVNPDGESSLVVLVDLHDKTALPIFIGFTEARAIGLKMNDIKTIRPMTHDLMKTIVDRLEAKLVRVVINKVEGNIIYAILHMRLGDSEIEIDSRPSDAIALALRTGTPIFASREVVEAIGVALGELDNQNRFVMRQGLTVQKMTPLLAQHFGLDVPEGVLVSGVQPGSPAEGAGLKTGDVIIEINGQKIDDLREFKAIVRGIEEGKRITLLVRRGKESIPMTMSP